MKKEQNKIQKQKQKIQFIVRMTGHLKKHQKRI